MIDRTGRQVGKGEGRRFLSPEYTRYMRSARWKELRMAAIRAAHFTCEAEDCGFTYPETGKGLEVHHLNYETFGNENINCLRALCPPCHRKADEERRAERWEALRGAHYKRVQGFAKAVYGADWDETTDFVTIEKSFKRWLDKGAPKRDVGYTKIPDWTPDR